jgi:hypothetical protein
MGLGARHNTGPALQPVKRNAGSNTSSSLFNCTSWFDNSSLRGRFRVYKEVVLCPCIWKANATR